MPNRAQQRERRQKRRLDVAGTSRGDSSSSSSPEDERAPWPRDDGQPFRVTISGNPKAEARSQAILNRPISEEWDVYDSITYNAWLEVDVQPTKFIDPDVIRKIEITRDLKNMLQQLGLGTMASQPYDLYPSLVRQFMATVRFEYKNQPTSVASNGVLSFFARGIRYYVTVPELCEIYHFTDPSATSTNLSSFPRVTEFWEIFGTGPWSSALVNQADIRHPTLRYFMRIIASTLMCKMEPNKVRIHELTLLYHALNGLVDLTHLDPDHQLLAPNLGAVFAEHLVSLKTKPLTGTSAKHERVGSLLTPIFQHLGIRLPEDSEDTSRPSVDTSRPCLDAAHLRSSLWIDREYRWSYRTTEGNRQIILPHRESTRFGGQIDILRFQPAEHLVIVPPTQRRAPGSLSRTASQPTSAASLPPFPDLSGMDTGDERVFRRGVMDALQAIWARVSRCRCLSRASTAAFDPSVPGPSHQYRQDDGDDDESSGE